MNFDEDDIEQQMFNTQNAPRVQQTNCTSSELDGLREITEPKAPKPPTVKKVTSVKHNNDGMDKVAKVSAVVIIVILLLLYFNGNRTTNKLSPPLETDSASYNMPTIGKVSKKGSNLSTLEETPVTSVNELVWVTYSKYTTCNANNVVDYMLECNSNLGDFEVSLSKSEYVQLKETGILPITITKHTYKDDTVLYDNKRLHKDWKKLLEGKVN